MNFLRTISFNILSLILFKAASYARVNHKQWCRWVTIESFIVPLYYRSICTAYNELKVTAPSYPVAASSGSST